MKIVRAIWNDGSMTTGNNYREVEDNIRAAQWQPYKTRKEFRKDMAHRARVWSGRRVSTLGTSGMFLDALAGAGLFLLVVEEVPDTEES